ncbi:hypothetical protein GGS23DRAFT_570547 [Durotheca rogersii]|uniref:uncharacterized protein n=1 Tax=Durotheca rogersii TaxID=419775 RepID=UPI002220C4E3|nr:uncharacterized protein GGS23DRAFT_570547 [Durotheca rogersii]KAI5862508.1 hypothetical protein GGS23DRAFT_570547 [Durotheca rogersii]
MTQEGESTTAGLTKFSIGSNRSSKLPSLREHLLTFCCITSWIRVLSVIKMFRSAGISASNSQQTQIVKLEALDASQSYFSQVPNFNPNDDAGFEEEFGRFASSQNITPGSSAWRQHRTKAIRHEMIFHYSQQVKSDDDEVSDDDKVKKEHGAPAGFGKKKTPQRKLQVYQNMCREVGLEPLDTIDGCVANLKSQLVNIVDYIDAKRHGSAVVVWEPERFEEFKRYTLAPSKRIDQKEARRGDGFLAALLQNLRSSDAANTYKRRRDIAVVARDRHTNRVSRGISGPRNTTRPFAIKQELHLGATNKGVKQESEVDYIHGLESNFTSPERNLENDPDTDGKYEGFSIHNSESSLSLPQWTIGEGTTDTRAGSPTSSIASLGPDEIPPSSQKRAKRKLHASTQVEDSSSQDALASRPGFKRSRTQGL